MTWIVRVLHWACRLALAGIFLYSGYVKLQATLQFAAAIADYKLLPDTFVYPLATYLPWLELALGAWVLTGYKIRWAASASALLLLGFTIVLTVTYMRGIEADCGCFGFGDRISPRTIARDALMMVPAVLLLLEKRLSALLAKPSPPGVG